MRPKACGSDVEESGGGKFGDPAFGLCVDKKVADCGIGSQAFGVEENDIALVEVFIESDAGEAWGSKDAESRTDGED